MCALSSEFAAGVVDDEVGYVFEGEGGGVDAEVVAAGVAPALVGVEVVEVGAELVAFAGEGYGFVFVCRLDACHYAACAVGVGGVHEDVDHVGAVAQDVVSATAHYDAWLGVGQLVYEVALSLVYAVGCVYAVAQPRHWVEAHREGDDGAHDARGAFVVFLEVLEVVSGLAGGFDQKLFVVEPDAEAVGDEAP